MHESVATLLHSNPPSTVSTFFIQHSIQPSIALSAIKVKPKNQGNLREIVITFARLFIIPVTLHPIRICTARLS